MPRRSLGEGGSALNSPQADHVTPDPRAPKVLEPRGPQVFYARPFSASPLWLSPDKIADGGYDSAVSASEIIKELPKLSDTERLAVLDKLRELAQLDDERWEELLNDPKPRPKLKAFLRQSAAEGESPLDPRRL